jgi:hypothetical protein
MIEHPCPLYIRPHSLLAEALSPKLVPTPEELESLGKEVNELE